MIDRDSVKDAHLGGCEKKQYSKGHVIVVLQLHDGPQMIPALKVDQELKAGQ